MPSHCSLATVGTRVMSNGEFVGALDWRANRLVDHLARIAAELVTVPDLACIIRDQFSKAVEYCAASLGVVTHAANNHIIPVTREDGVVVNRKVRDNNADQARERENSREVPSALLVLSCRLRATKLIRVVRPRTPVMLIAPHPSQSACLCLSTLR